MRIGIVGGSVAGLSLARALLAGGHEVAVFERSSGHIAGRGAGVALDPGVAPRLGALSALPVSGRVVFGTRGQRLWTRPSHKQTSAWSEIYRALRAELPADCLRPGHACVQVGPVAGGAALAFADGQRASYDWVIGADGIGSMVRRHVDPGFAPSYCGYVALRGVAPLSRLPAQARWLAEHTTDPGLVNVYAERSHLVAYRIPTSEGPALNWMWYRNVPEAELGAFMTDRDGQTRRYTLPAGGLPCERRRALVDELRVQLPAGVSEAAEVSGELFVQAIYRGVPARWVRGRVIVIGDAAHTAVPHIGAGVSLAVEDAGSLAAVLRPGVEHTALTAWAAARRRAVCGALDVSARLGRSIQSAEWDWNRLSPDDFERWWRELVGSERLYFEAPRESASP